MADGADLATSHALVTCLPGSEFERFRPLVEPLRLPFPLVVVDTREPVAVDHVVAQLESAWAR